MCWPDWSEYSWQNLLGGYVMGCMAKENVTPPLALKCLSVLPALQGGWGGGRPQMHSFKCMSVLFLCFQACWPFSVLGHLIPFWFPCNSDIYYEVLRLNEKNNKILIFTFPSKWNMAQVFYCFFLMHANTNRYFKLYYQSLNQTWLSCVIAHLPKRNNRSHFEFCLFLNVRTFISETLSKRSSLLYVYSG